MKIYYISLFISLLILYAYTRYLYDYGSVRDEIDVE